MTNDICLSIFDEARDVAKRFDYKLYPKIELHITNDHQKLYLATLDIRPKEYTVIGARRLHYQIVTPYDPDEVSIQIADAVLQKIADDIESGRIKRDIQPSRNFYKNHTNKDYRPDLACYLGYKSRSQAEDIILSLRTIINTYGFATIGDLKDLMGEPTTADDDRYGWLNIPLDTPIHRRDNPVRPEIPPFRICFPTPVKLSDVNKPKFATGKKQSELEVHIKADSLSKQTRAVAHGLIRDLKKEYDVKVFID